MIQTENSAPTVMDIPHLDPSIMAGVSTISYTGIAGSRMAMGDNVIRRLSDNAMKIAGDSRVKQGMELALFLEVPGSERPLCIPQVRVLWLKGHRCGMQLPPQKVGTMDWMDALLDCH